MGKLTYFRPVSQNSLRLGAYVGTCRTMSVSGFLQLFVFVLAACVGYQVIRRVPALLHTPLMSATNAISAISVVGSLVLAGSDRGTLASLLGVIAVAAATINVVGGFLITDRMLKMFRRSAPNEAAR